MVGIGASLAGALAALTTVITALAPSIGLSPVGWSFGLLCGAVMAACVRLGLVRSRTTALGPADLVTLGRATLTCCAAALVVDSFLRDSAGTGIVVLASVVLVLDAVDGWVARRTRTTPFGARFDGEVDAFLILVLSVYVSRSAGVWVLALGLARYAFAVAGWAWPWMRRPLPYRYWRKVVAAVQGVVLTVVAADQVAPSVATVGLLVALVLLAESFGRDVLWLWVRRHQALQATHDTGRAEASSPPRERVP